MGARTGDAGILEASAGAQRARALLGAGAILAVVTSSASAGAADIAPDGTLVFAGDALAVCGFESLAELRAAGAGVLRWSSSGQLVTSALGADDEARILTGADGALEGGHGLLVRADLGPGLALRAPALAAAAGGRVSVSMWGRAHGAEPVLEVVYSPDTIRVGPSLVRVVAIRTGRETSDGWAEYSTGPVDGTVLTAPLRAVVLTARYVTDAGASVLAGSDLSPTTRSARILDPSAYAVIDAVEIRPEPGAATPASATCTQSTVDAACGAAGECQFGHCVDGSAVWGPLPADASHRADLVARWAFVARHLHADRRATANAARSFAGAAERLAAATSPRGYFGQLQRLVAGLRDSHTSLGAAPSLSTVTYPAPDSTSGPLDLCLGLVRNDLAADEEAFAVFAVGGHGVIQEKLRKGDVLTAIDGVPAASFIAAVLPRFIARLPSDPASDPSQTALVLPKLLGRYARTVTFSRCQAGGGCAPLPDVPIADEAYAHVSGALAYPGSNLVCSLRFHAAVASPPPDGAPADAVVAETANGVTSVQLDGFSGLHTLITGWHAWEDPWTAALTGNPRVLVDARLGHGGKFYLGKWLFHLLRGTDQPYGVFAMPRGAHDDPDPAWLLGSSWDACLGGDSTVDACAWAGGQSTFTEVASPLGAPARVAWVNGNDVSMNDIVPRLLSGRPGFRVFGPHPSQGAYGEVSALPPILPSWGRGSLQVLDMRFGPTPAEARAAPWESGKGVVPDEVVLQKVSDILADRDTVLAAAKEWLSR